MLPAVFLSILHHDFPLELLHKPLWILSYIFDAFLWGGELSQYLVGAVFLLYLIGGIGLIGILISLIRENRDV
jgi:hypothetical protein